MVGEAVVVVEAVNGFAVLVSIQNDANLFAAVLFCRVVVAAALRVLAIEEVDSAKVVGHLMFAVDVGIIFDDVTRAGRCLKCRICDDRGRSKKRIATLEVLVSFPTFWVC